MEDLIYKKEQDRTVAKKKLFVATIPATRGLITQACKNVCISRDTYYRWRKEDPAFVTAVRSALYGPGEERGARSGKM